MLVGIISDTHGSLPTAVHTAFNGCAHIIHAGDVGAPSILEELGYIATVTAVMGNCDWPEYGPEVGRFASITLAGVRFFVTHMPQDAEESLRGRRFITAQQPLPHVCVHGHTHIPRIEHKGAVLMLCPGSPNQPRGGSRASVMLVDVENSRVTDVRLIELYPQDKEVVQ